MITFDSVASAVFREQQPQDANLKPVRVELAMGKTKPAMQAANGDVVVDGPPLFGMGVAVEEAGFSEFWGPRYWHEGRQTFCKPAERDRPNHEQRRTCHRAKNRRQGALPN